MQSRKQKNGNVKRKREKRLVELRLIAALDHHKRAFAILAQLYHTRAERLLRFHRVCDAASSFRHTDLPSDTDLHDLSIEALGASGVVARHGRAFTRAGWDGRWRRGLEAFGANHGGALSFGRGGGGGGGGRETEDGCVD